jgi:hypothetical protein
VNSGYTTGNDSRIQQVQKKMALTEQKYSSPQPLPFEAVSPALGSQQARLLYQKGMPKSHGK